MKCTSAGLILTDGKKFLGCHSTGNYFYDLPKGTIKAGESAIEACVRETKEETGLDIQPSELIDLGVYEYNFYKDLHLFISFSDNLPSTDTLRCTSYFYHPQQNKYQPEADGFRFIEFEKMEYYLTKNMFKVITEIRPLVQGTCAKVLPS